MKTLVKLIILGVVIAGTNRYLEEEGISVKMVLNNVINEGKKLWIEFERSIKTKDRAYHANEGLPERVPHQAPTDKKDIRHTHVPGPIKEKEHRIKNDNTGKQVHDNTGKRVIKKASITSNLTLSGTVEKKEERSSDVVYYNRGIKWIRTVTRQQSNNSWTLLEKYESLPKSVSAKDEDGSIISSEKPVSAYHYIDFSSKLTMLASMSTNVHEIAHAYWRFNSIVYARDHGLALKWDNVNAFIYISPHKYYYVSVPEKLLFPARELTKVIPPELHSFRFDTYIDGNTSTQSEGIMGLLNEFHAYYLGTKFTFDMLDAYKNIETGRAEGVLKWVSNIQSEIGAFYEFDFFILEYLKYMRDNNFNDYRELLAHKDFINAYMAILNEYSKLVNDYKNTIDREIIEINKNSEYKAWKENNTLWVQKNSDTNCNGSVISPKDVEAIKFMLKSNRYNVVLNDLGMRKI